MSRAIFVTATDTGAGKTWVTGHLVRHLLSQGIDAQALKPLASGLSASGLNEDVATLLEAQGKQNADQINFHTYVTACAPALAAQIEEHRLNADDLTDWVVARAAEADVTLIEGIGGLMVPLIPGRDQTWLVSDWLQETAAAEVLLVAPLRLGCMNHLLLSCALLAGLHRGPNWIVLNDIDGDDSGEETKQILLPYLRRILKSDFEVICVRQPEDLWPILD